MPLKTVLGSKLYSTFGHARPARSHLRPCFPQHGPLCAPPSYRTMAFVVTGPLDTSVAYGEHGERLVGAFPNLVRLELDAAHLASFHALSGALLTFLQG